MDIHIHEEHGLAGVVLDAAMISMFVFVIMLVVEYLNVLTSGRIQKRLSTGRWKQYLLAVAIGAIPGCLGGFAVVSLFSHGVVSLGAVMAAMMASTGDEAFVMYAKFPMRAVLLTAGLCALGVLAGWLTDRVMARRGGVRPCEQPFDVHEGPTECYATGRILQQWRNCTAVRGILGAVTAIFAVVVISGHWESEGWDWMRVTLLVLSLAALFIVSTVPDHFLEEHLWQHVARRHMPRVFLWTLGALLVLYAITEPLGHEGLRESLVRGEGKWLALVAACVVGLIPQSGPHLIFVFAYIQGAVPFAILVANSIVQDGHSMLPMLAHSRRVVVGIKAVKFAIGMAIGAAMLLLGE